METSNNFKKLNIIDIEKLLLGLDSIILKKEFINICLNMDIKSKYFLGKKGNGKFWNGFRTTSTTTNRIIKSIIDDLKKDINEINYDELIDKCIEIEFEKSNISKDEFIKKIIETNNSDFIEIIFKLYSIKNISKDKLEEIKITNLKNEYDNKIVENEKRMNEDFISRELLLKKENEKLKKEMENSEKRFRETIIKLNKAIEEKNNLYNEVILKYKEKETENNQLINSINQLNNKNIESKKFNNLFNHILKENMREKVLNYLTKNTYDTKEKITVEMIDLISRLTKNINNNKDIEEILLELYVLNKVVEE